MWIFAVFCWLFFYNSKLNIFETVSDINFETKQIKLDNLGGLLNIVMGIISDSLLTKQLIKVIIMNSSTINQKRKPNQRACASVTCWTSPSLWACAVTVSSSSSCFWICSWKRTSFSQTTACSFSNWKTKAHNALFKNHCFVNGVHEVRDPCVSPVQRGQIPSLGGAARWSGVAPEALGCWPPPRPACSSARGAPPPLRRRFPWRSCLDSAVDKTRCWSQIKKPWVVLLVCALSSPAWDCRCGRQTHWCFSLSSQIRYLFVECHHLCFGLHFEFDEASVSFILLVLWIWSKKIII